MFFPRFGVASRLIVLLPAVAVVDAVVAVVRDLRKPPARIVDRSSGQSVHEPRPLGDHIQLSLVWSTVIGSRILCRSRLFLNYLERLTSAAGAAMDDPASRERIDRFIVDNGVDTTDLDRDPGQFATLNEFFARPLRAGVRPIAEPGLPARAVSPADCRLRCWIDADDQTLISTKGHRISVRGILGVDAATSGHHQRAAQKRISDFYDRTAAIGFALAVCRLAPGDYHRFHWPVDAKWDAADVLEIIGDYHSVSPTATRSTVDVLGTNRRTTLLARSEAFGPVALVIVGALKVSSIELTGPPGDARKGDQLGLFKYGGSTVVVIFGADAINFDADLIAASTAGYETKVLMGESLGVAPR